MARAVESKTKLQELSKFIGENEDCTTETFGQAQTLGTSKKYKSYASAQHHSHVPKFGSWDRDNKRYTTEFENARKAKAAEKMNPNDPEAIANGTGGQEDSIQDPPNVDTDSKISTEKQREGEGNLGHNQQGRNTYNCQKSETEGVGSMQDPLNVDSESKNFTEKQHSEGNVSSKSTLSEIASDKSNSDCSPRQSVELSLKSDRKKVTGEESNSFSLSVQGHYRQRSGIYTSDESQHRRASVPKFGDWDEMDPASGEGFTVIFDKLKEEKQIATANFLPVTAQASTYSHSRINNRGSSSRSKMFCCLCPSRSDRY
ncbi:hypothetical protein ACOSP7_012790 [Xanthoceras sorbifolium]